MYAIATSYKIYSICLIKYIVSNETLQTLPSLRIVCDLNAPSIPRARNCTTLQTVPTGNSFIIFLLLK